MNGVSQVASSHKISRHQEKLKAYLRGEHIAPVTLELDITSQCTRICEDCPSCRSPIHMELSLPFIDELFSSFEKQTKGLLLTGGEPTVSPVFGRTLKLAWARGFEEIAVVTNGALLDQPRVLDALLEHVSTIRVSMYDWAPESCGGIRPVLEKIELVRKNIQKTKSTLQIGISALTNEERVPRLAELTELVRNAGADWIYFHPMCTGWNNGHLKPMSQRGVVEEVQRIKLEKTQSEFDVHISENRYVDEPIYFEGYHAAHFLLVIGADGKNYLGAEVKYQPAFALCDLRDVGVSNFLRNSQRLQTIESVHSDTYTALLSRHRGVLYNSLIEKINGEGIPPAGEYKFPHIL
jgi:MoaA/NifB/PqqE/SkfB family radical SAM enzyme